MRKIVQMGKGKWACAWGRRGGSWAVQHLAGIYVKFQFPALLKRRRPLPLTASCGKAVQRMNGIWDPTCTPAPAVSPCAGTKLRERFVCKG